MCIGMCVCVCVLGERRRMGAGQRLGEDSHMRAVRNLLRVLLWACPSGAKCDDPQMDQGAEGSRPISWCRDGVGGTASVMSQAV